MQVTHDKVIKVLGKIKCGKPAGSSGITAEMLKAAVKKGTGFLHEFITSTVM